MNLLGMAYSRFLLHQAMKEHTYEGMKVEVTGMPTKKKTSVNIEGDAGNNGSSLSLRSTDQA